MSLERKDLMEIHAALPGLVSEFENGKLGRREFLRISTLLGLGAPTAYALVGMAEPIREAQAATMGGWTRILGPVD